MEPLSPFEDVAGTEVSDNGKVSGLGFFPTYSGLSGATHSFFLFSVCVFVSVS